MKEKNKSGQAASIVLTYGRPHLSGPARLAVCIACCISMMFQAAADITPVLAADGQASVTFQELNDSAVFLKQSQSRVCTLTSSAMMVRRTAMLMGNDDWQLITEKSIRKDAWSEGSGLKWDFTTYGITVAHKTLASKDELIRMLDKHPEGIVIYNPRKPHAVLVTDYTDGIFYCSDPSNDMPVGRYPIAQASITVESAARCWYVKQPTVTVMKDSIQDYEAEGADSKQDGGIGLGGRQDMDDNSSGQAGAENSSGPDHSAGTADDKNTGSGTDGADAEQTDADDRQPADEGISGQEQKDENADDQSPETNDDGLREYDVDGLTYRILDAQERTAACTGQTSDVKSAAVPSAVMIGEVEYQVVQIADRAFANAAKLKSVTIGSNVSLIGTKAFYKCKKLKTVTINAKNLEKIGTDAFAHIHKKAKIFVLSDLMEGFGKLLTGTSVPGTVVVGVNQASAKKQ